MKKQSRVAFDKNVQIIEQKRMEMPTVKEAGLKGTKNINRWNENRDNFNKERDKIDSKARHAGGNASEAMWKQQCEKECKDNPGLKMQIIHKYLKKGH